MRTVKQYRKTGEKIPSIFALLVDDIRNMSPSKQKLLWMELNKEKIYTMAKELDISASANNLTNAEIDSLIKEARKYGLQKKKS